MTRFYDKSGKLVEIEMKIWDEIYRHHSPDLSADLILCGDEHYSEEKEAYPVESVDSLIDWCKAWARGDSESETDPYDLAQQLRHQTEHERSRGSKIVRENITDDEFLEMAERKIREEIASRCLWVDDIYYDPAEDTPDEHEDEHEGAEKFNADKANTSLIKIKDYVTSTIHKYPDLASGVPSVHWCPDYDCLSIRCGYLFWGINAGGFCSTYIDTRKDYPRNLIDDIITPEEGENLYKAFKSIAREDNRPEVFRSKYHSLLPLYKGNLDDVHFEEVD